MDGYVNDGCRCHNSASQPCYRCQQSQIYQTGSGTAGYISPSVRPSSNRQTITAFERDSAFDSQTTHYSSNAPSNSQINNIYGINAEPWSAEQPSHPQSYPNTTQQFPYTNAFPHRQLGTDSLDAERNSSHQSSQRNDISPDARNPNLPSTQTGGNSSSNQVRRLRVMIGSIEQSHRERRRNNHRINTQDLDALQTLRSRLESMLQQSGRSGEGVAENESGEVEDGSNDEEDNDDDDVDEERDVGR